MSFNPRIKSLFLICLQALLFQVQAQILRFEQIDDKLGLSQNSVFSIEQDSSGFLWIGTEDGLNRFDGYSFDVLRYHENDPASIYPGRIQQLSSYSNQLGVLTESGISLVNTRTFKSVNYIIPIHINSPRFLKLTAYGAWLGADNGLFLLDYKSGSFKPILKDLPITGIVVHDRNYLLVSSADKLLYIKQQSGKIEKEVLNVDFLIRGLCVNDKNKIAILTDEQSVILGSLKSGEFIASSTVQLGNVGNYTCMYATPNLVLIGFDDGLRSINFKTGDVQVLRHESGNKFSLSTNKILSIFEDRNNNIWIGTRTGGLNRYHPFRFKFNSLSGEEAGFGLNCFALSIWNNDGLVATDDGRVLLFDFGRRSLAQVANLPGIGIFSITPRPDLQGHALLSTQDGIFDLTVNTGKASRINLLGENRLISRQCNALLHESESRFWVGTREGLLLVDVQSREVLKTFDIANSGLSGNNVRTFYRLNSGSFLIATTRGLYRYSIQGDQIEPVLVSRNGRKIHVVSVLMVPDGSLLIGTISQGLLVQKKDGSVLSITDNQGLANNNVYGLLLASNRREVWMSTNSGLSRLDLRDYSIKNYDSYDGLQGNEFNEKVACKLSDNQLVFGGVNGFSWFTPEQLKDDTTNCPVVIKQIKVFNKQLDLADSLYLTYKENDISFDFVALDYNFVGNNRYYYKIEGLKEEWIDAGKRRFASFSQLPPGEYRFLVKASNADGIFSRNIASIRFVIAQPWWQTWLFKGLVLFMTLLLIGFGFYWRFRVVLRNEQQKMKVSGMMGELELKALRAQMNPHFIFNSLNSIQDFVLNHQGMEAAKYLSKFAKLVRMILDNSESTFISISQKIEFLRLYIELESLRMDNGFEFHLALDKSVNLDDQIPTMVIQPFVENAIWHGLQYKTTHRVLKLSLSMEDENILTCIIEDNGIGREAAMKIRKEKSGGHQSKAMKITAERIEILKKLYGFGPNIEVIDLVDSDGAACGTRIIVKLPIHHG